MSYLSEHYKAKCKNYDTCNNNCVLCRYSEQEILNRRLFIVRAEYSKEKNMFQVYPNYATFASSKLNKDIAYHEVIFDFMPQRFRADIDLEYDIITDMQQVVADGILRLTNAFYIYYGSLSISEDIEWTVTRVYDFNYYHYKAYNNKRKNPIMKVGFHITSVNYMAPNQSEFKNFMNIYCNNPKSLGYKDYIYFDKNIGKKIQNWRIVNSGKLGKSNRVKKIWQDGFYGEETTIVTNRYNTLHHGKEIEPMPIMQNKQLLNIYDDDYENTFQQDINNEYKDILTEIMNAHMSELDKESFVNPRFTKQNKVIYINFTRTKPSFCDICEREHMNENSLYFIYNTTNNMIKKLCLRYNA